MDNSEKETSEKDQFWNGKSEKMIILKRKHLEKDSSDKNKKNILNG